MKRAIVIGSGAGGATAAKELQGKFDVTILEAGGEFRPLTVNMTLVEKAKRAGLLFWEKEIEFIFPSMRVAKTSDQMLLVCGKGTGGTTTLATGNAMRVDGGFRAIGVNLDDEFAELYDEIPVHIEHRRNWRAATKRLFEICEEMGLDPQPLSKMGYAERCTNCGRCILGCPSGAKLDSRFFLNQAVAKGAKLVTECRVEHIVIENGGASGVVARRGIRKKFIPADLIIVAAGGFGTPVILENSGITCENRLFVDPVLCVAAEWPGAFQNKEISMPFVVQRDHFIIAPYFDYFSYFFNRAWRHRPENTLGLMIKLADTNVGRVKPGKIEKTLTKDDRQRLLVGVELCREIFSRMGISPRSTVLGSHNAGHPGGTLPLTAASASNLHDGRLPGNVYVADSSLFPESTGNPPSFTIMALAKRVGKVCIGAV